MSCNSDCKPCGSEDTHEMELSAFYKDCDCYNDHTLFGGPVCGSDGKTYANCVHLACLNHWRCPADKVKLVSEGACQDCEVKFPWSPVYWPVCGCDNVTYANVEALQLHNLRDDTAATVKHEGVCPNPDLGCLGVDYTPWQGAVCATNGRTYPSVQAIADMRKFGQCLDVLHDGGCTVEEVKQRLRSRAEVCDMARNFYEVNPVCGKDGEVYGNPYILLCYKPNVKAKYMGECDSPLHRACQTAVNIDKGKMATPGPVCGSDGLTYTSGYHLDCASNNDKHLYMRHEGDCTHADNPCVYMPEVTDGGDPVCGSDGVTYINSYSLWCTQRKHDPFLRFFHDGPCFRRCVECACNSHCSATCGAN